MSFFKKLTPEETDLIVSLPYRVGHWISHIDDLEKTKRDDKWEAQAMDQAIRKIARQNTPNSLPRVIMSEVDSNRHQWQGWAAKDDKQNDDAVLFSDIGLALDLVRLKISPKALKPYKQILWYMALVVAQAFGEDDDPDQEMHIDHFFADMKRRFFGTKLGQQPENMSNDEKAALKKLKAALKN
ncbi:MAG: hypothetical protein AAF988_03225 [Pseudomonadota bacterium]